MAKVKLNPFIKELRGAIGDVVFKTSSTGQVYTAQRPSKSCKAPSEAQKAHRLRFKEATAYAKAALADSDLRARYEELAAREGKAAYALAVSDYMNGKSPLLPR